ncbi:type II toxin-antitoxin system RelE/ParE family toxin [Ruthenibacterium lactatiformans]|uniref:type II toxin-antitoxin system RelE family toxin n=1 Tax=Ruthenibacterium lactatiformans TaxID=1550024 RepID=UPI0026660C13|nr:type II toxin-antitoxin system RelE/ParE family toxin [Ruthenibacterium lactatiformans]
MTYRIEIDKPAMKFLAKQPQPQRERLLRSIYALPHSGDIKPLSGTKGLYRLRVGSFRVIYTVIDDTLIVQVLAVGNRGDVYK